MKLPINLYAENGDCWVAESVTAAHHFEQSNDVVRCTDGEGEEIFNLDRFEGAHGYRGVLELEHLAEVERLTYLVGVYKREMERIGARKFKDCAVTEMGLKGHTVGALLKRSIHTLGDLLAMSQGDLYCGAGISRCRGREIEEKLAERGLRLGWKQDFDPTAYRIVHRELIKAEIKLRELEKRDEAKIS